MSLSDSRTRLKFIVALARESQANYHKTKIHSRLGGFDETMRMAVGGHAEYPHTAVPSESARAARSGDLTRDP